MPEPGQLFEVPQSLSEKAFQKMVTDRLTEEGYNWVFVRKMRTPDGRWLTGTSDAGWLDLTALRGPHILAIELKSAKGKPTPGQIKWLNAWHRTAAFAWLLDPSDSLQAIANWIHDPSKAPVRYGW
jgi:hypothetical protein